MNFTRYPIRYPSDSSDSSDVSARRSTRRLLVGAVAGLALVASACGGSDEAEPAPAEATAPAEEPTPVEESAPEPDDASAATVGSADSDLGTIIVDQDGRTLYGFTPDEAGEPTCVDGCADAWPPYVVDGDSVPAGLDESIFSVVAHPSGVHQLKAGKWPLYYFAADSVAGDVNGQGSGDVWFVVADDGSLIKGAAGIVAPADGQDASSSGEAPGSYDY